MSRTTRRHESLGRTARRGPKNKTDEDTPKATLKSTKQKRARDRATLRKEWR